MMAAACATEAVRFKPVYCVCGRFLCKASVGSWVEVQCRGCKRVIVMQIDEG
jgi:phage FluMu protein Com